MTEPAPERPAPPLDAVAPDTAAVAAPSPAVRTPRRGGNSASVRVRMLAGLLALMSLAFALAGATLYTIQVASTNDRIDASLRHAVGVFRSLADDTTPRPSGERLLYLAMQRTLPAADEGMVAFVNGQLRWHAPAQVPLRLENDTELMTWIAGSTGDQAMLTSVTTTMTSYRLVTLPVAAADGGSGRLVYAYDYAAERGRVNATFLSYVWVGVGALVVVGVVGWFVVGRLLRPLRALTHTARRITQDHLSERIPVTGTDDLAELTRTVNSMLDRVEGAVKSQQRLLDDAGHELRTPITVVRGHLELMDVNDPEDARAVRELALDELERMSFLVTDLVTLAQSGTAEFVRPTAVDVGDLMQEVFSKASALGDRDWRCGPVPAGVYELDPRRVTQALLQLCSNAVKFSATGTRVWLGGESTAQGGLRLWVRDEGSGIRPEDLPTIFTRFARGSDAKRTEGAGLGLSIVGAIASAHGGSVEVSSHPGAGSTFALLFPPSRTAPADPDDLEDTP